jgi:hypothetical protein
MVDQILHARRIAVERGHWPHHYGPHFGHCHHVAEVPEVKRRLAGKENQPATFLELHIGARARRLSVIPFEIAARDRIEHGATIIPAVRNDPLAIDAPMGMRIKTWTTKACRIYSASYPAALKKFRHSATEKRAMMSPKAWEM